MKANTVFVDTSAWLAAMSTREQAHADCARYYDDLTAGRWTVVTTSLVVTEMHGLLVRRRGPVHGLTLLEVVRTDPSFEVIRVDDDLESRAVERWLRRYPLIPMSLTDAVSFETMREHGIRNAFTLDHHFKKVGYRMVPGV